MLHFDFRLVTGGSRAATMASSKTFFNCGSENGMSTRMQGLVEREGFGMGLTPFCVRAEHSTYLTAPSSLAKRSPASGATGRCFCRANFSNTAGSSRKST